MVTWTKPGTDVQEKYVVEFIHNPKDWEKVCSGDHDAPWELYEKRTYENIDDAITFYMIQRFSETCFDVKLFETLSVNGEEICEKYIEPAATFAHNLRKTINKTTSATIDTLENRVDDLEKSLDLYRKFIERYNAEKLFDDFMKECF